MGWTISKSPEDPTYADNPYLYGDVLSVKSDFNMGRYNEQLFLDLGIAVAISNPQAVATPLQITTQNNENYESRYWGGFVNDKALFRFYSYLRR